MSTKHFFHIIILLSALSIGCEQAQSTRQYVEITHDAPARSVRIPNDEIHSALQGQSSLKESSPADGLDIDNMRNMVLPDSAKDSTEVSWTTPNGWREELASGLRKATFTAKGVECSIITLSGAGGGLESNVARWMRQVNIDVPPGTQFQQFLSSLQTFQTQGGLNAQIVDLTKLQAADPDQTISMVAAVIHGPESVAFVKMTGEKSAIKRQFDKFFELARSIKMN